MIEFNELETGEKDAINSLLLLLKHLENCSLIAFDKSDLEGIILDNSIFHSDRIIDFLKENDFIELFTHRPTYKLLDEGHRLLKCGSIEKYCKTMKEETHSTSITGDNNTVNISSGDISQNVTNNSNSKTVYPEDIIKAFSLINTDKGIEASKQPKYNHFSADIKINGESISAPKLYTKLANRFNTPTKKYVIPILFADNENSHREILHREKLGRANIINYYRESALSIKSNNIRFEVARYTENPMTINLIEELLSLFHLIFFCETLGTKLDLEITIGLETNGELNFSHSENFIRTDAMAINSYILNWDEHFFTINLKDTDNTSLDKLLESIIEAFPTKSKMGNPFLQLDMISQALVYDDIRKQLS